MAICRFCFTWIAQTVPMSAQDCIFWSATRAAREIREGNVTSATLVEAWWKSARIGKQRFVMR